MEMFTQPHLIFAPQSRAHRWIFVWKIKNSKQQKGENSRRTEQIHSSFKLSICFSIYHQKRLHKFCQLYVLLVVLFFSFRNDALRLACAFRMEIVFHLTDIWHIRIIYMHSSHVGYIVFISTIESDMSTRHASASMGNLVHEFVPSIAHNSLYNSRSSVASSF